MPVLFTYLLKVSGSLVVVYLFYRLVLRRLTFYTANRWYLLGYSLLSFFIPLLNITPFIEQHQWSRFRMVQVIPALDQYTTAAKEVTNPSHTTLFTIWEGCLLFFAAGTLLLFVRLAVQYFSFLHIRKNAQLIAANGIKLYQMDTDVLPFSFGNAIFINQHRHTEAELQEIIRHEFVHIRQRHTIDVLFTELLCILNWYNPAAWGLRRAVRQNLEFIADNEVLQSGLDKQTYQYLLLNVMGQPQFRIATPFNFSSLKNRIVMMNKIKSAKAHLVKFLFMVPLLAVLLLAFRNVADESSSKNKVTLTVSGLVLEAATQMPLSGVALHEVHSNLMATTDSRGFFTIAIPVSQYPVQTQLSFRKEGFKDAKSNSLILSEKQEPIGTVEIVGLVKRTEKKSKAFVQSYALSTGNPFISAAPGYDEVLKMFVQTKQEQERKTPEAAPAQRAALDTVPPPPPPPVLAETPPADALPDDYKAFLARNPAVAAVRWTERHVIIELKSGKKENYLRNDRKQVALVEKKWGLLPVAPPPPPPVPEVVPPTESVPVIEPVTPQPEQQPSGRIKKLSKEPALVQAQLIQKQASLMQEQNAIQQNQQTAWESQQQLAQQAAAKKQQLQRVQRQTHN